MAEPKRHMDVLERVLDSPTHKAASTQAKQPAKKSNQCE
jgi:hypothetical protein